MYQISFYVILFHQISCDLIWSKVIWSNLILSNLIWHHLVSPDLIQYHLIWYYLIYSVLTWSRILLDLIWSKLDIIWSNLIQFHQNRFYLILSDFISCGLIKSKQDLPWQQGWPCPPSLRTGTLNILQVPPCLTTHSWHTSDKDIHI